MMEGAAIICIRSCATPDGTARLDGWDSAIKSI